MQLLLGLFFFSILLITGSSLQCVNCLAINGYCSDVKEECPNGTQVCMSLLLKSEDKTPIEVFMKKCATKIGCKRYGDQIGKANPTEIPAIPAGVVLKKVTCSRAPPSFASVFLAFLGLLLMKLLF